MLLDLLCSSLVTDGLHLTILRVPATQDTDTHRHRHRHTGTGTQAHTHRHTHTQAHTHTHTHTHTQTETEMDNAWRGNRTPLKIDDAPLKMIERMHGE